MYRNALYVCISQKAIAKEKPPLVKTKDNTDVWETIFPSCQLNCSEC